MTFVQLIEYYKKNTSSKIMQKIRRSLVSDLFVFLKKDLYLVKASGL